MTQAERDAMTVAEGATRFLVQTVSGNRVEAQSEINRFVRWVGGQRRLSSLSSHEVSTYIERLGTTTTDILKRLEPVKAFLAYAKKEGYTATNLGVNLRPKKGSARASSGPSRSQQGERAYLTEEGYKALIDELETLKAERPNIAQELKLAMADKDFRENAPLDAARDRQGHVEARIRELEALMKQAEIMHGAGADIVRAALGCNVVLLDQTGSAMQFTLVHPHEANPVQGKVSVASPTGKAVLGHAAGDDVSVTAPAGVLQYRVQAVEPGA